jgi:hypothetical protein
MGGSLPDEVDDAAVLAVDFVFALKPSLSKTRNDGSFVAQLKA